MELSQLAKNFPASMIRKLFEKAREYEDVLYFTMGEPNFTSPDVVKEAVKKSLDNNQTYYGPNAGTDELRERIAKEYNERYKTCFDRRNVIVTFGATEGLLLAMKAVLNAEDEVLVLTPHYPNYVGQIQAIGAVPVFVELKKENDFQINLDDIENKRTAKTKMLIINSPNNPLGTVIDRKLFLELGEYTKAHDLVLLADEVYHQLVYSGAEHYSFASPEQANFKNTFTVDSFSKTYSMTGYRIGSVVTEDTVAVSAMTEFKEGIAFAVPSFIQEAAIAALDHGKTDVEKMFDAYNRRRKLIENGLNEINGIGVLKTQGAFYAFADITEFNLSSEEFAYKFLEEEKVALLPGSSFGKAGEGYLRISYAASDEDINEMLKRLSRFVQTL